MYYRNWLTLVGCAHDGHSNTLIDFPVSLLSSIIFLSKQDSQNTWRHDNTLGELYLLLKYFRNTN